MSRISQRVQDMNDSVTLKVTAEAKKLRGEGRDIILMSTGEPDYQVIPEVQEAWKKYANVGFDKYTNADGTPEFKGAMILKFDRDNNLTFTDKEVIATVGGKDGIFKSFQAVLNQGDGVIIAAPYWVSYPEQVKFAGGVPIIVDCDKENDYKITAKQLEQSIDGNPNAKMFVLNNPGNPNGAVYTEKELSDIADVLRRNKQVIVLEDAIYEHIVYDGEKHVSLAQVAPDLKENIIFMSGTAKGYAMPGSRMGFFGGPEDIISAIKKIQTQTTSNPPAICQAGAVAAIKADQGFLEQRLAEYQDKRDMMAQILTSVKGVNFSVPKGAFYYLVETKGLQECMECASDVDLTMRFLKEAGLAMIPGSGFGTPDHMRLSYPVADQTIEKAGEILHTYSNRYC